MDQSELGHNTKSTRTLVQNVSDHHHITLWKVLKHSNRKTTHPSLHHVQISGNNNNNNNSPRVSVSSPAKACALCLADKQSKEAATEFCHETEQGRQQVCQVRYAVSLHCRRSLVIY